MRAVLWAVVGVARFLYHFVVGDDLLVAVVMVLALVVTGVLIANRVNAWWLVPPVAVLMTATSLRRHQIS